MARGSPSWALPTLASDALVWLCVFILIGAPVSSDGVAPGTTTTTTSAPTTATLTVALAVLTALLWPCTLTEWCVLLYNSTTVAEERESGSGSKNEKVSCRGESHSEREVNTTTCITPFAWYTSPLVQGCVLALALLLGGLGPQLDWQMRVQAWPFPSLILLVAARGALWVMGVPLLPPPSPSPSPLPSSY